MSDIEKKLKDLERLKNVLTTEEYGKIRADIIASIDGGRGRGGGGEGGGGGRGEASALSVPSLPASSSFSSNKDDDDDENDNDENKNDDVNSDTIIRLIVSNTTNRKKDWLSLILPPRYGIDHRTKLVSVIDKTVLHKKKVDEEEDEEDEDKNDENDKEEFFQSLYHQIDTALGPLNKIRTTTLALCVCSILGFSCSLIVAEMYALAGMYLAVVTGTSIGTLYLY